MRISTILRTIGVCVTIPAAIAVVPLQTHAQVKSMPEVRYVVLHKPGPNWKAGVSAFEQVGLSAHVDHFRKLLNAGKLTMGGPFTDGASGGMMIPEPSVSEEEITKFASEDPAVQSGLLIFEVRPWLPALRQ